MGTVRYTKRKMVKCKNGNFTNLRNYCKQELLIDDIGY
jgi:hypothetical protein